MTVTSRRAALDLHIRWMLRTDLPQVLEMERHCFDLPWDQDDYRRCLRQRNVIGMVAEHDERIVGAMVYELFKQRLEVLNLMVHEDCRYRGVGRALVAKLKLKLAPGGRTRILVDIRESNLDAQLFLKAVDFRAVKILPHYEITGEDAYRFVYQQGG